MKRFASVFLLAAAVLLTLGATAPVLTGCSGGVCSADEETACTNTYNDCVAKASAVADEAAVKKCGDNYCACYDACGTTCDRSKIQ